MTLVELDLVLILPFGVGQGLGVIEMEVTLVNMDTQDGVVVADEIKTRRSERRKEHGIGARVDHALATIFAEVELRQGMGIT